MSKILILGGSGMVGTALQQECSIRKIDFWAPSHNEFDITVSNQVWSALENYLPDFVFNCVSLVGINPCEKNPDLAYKLHGKAVLDLSRNCEKLGCTLVQTSTHAIFDGKKSDFYSEEDSPSPTSTYAGTKLLSEQFAQSNCKKTYIARFPTLYGNRKNHSQGFVEKMIGLMKTKAEISVADDKIDSPTYATDAASALIGMVLDRLPYGVYHIANSGSVSYFDFVTAIRNKLQLESKILPAKDSDFPALAPKPLKTAFHSKKIPALRSWESALNAYIKDAYPGDATNIQDKLNVTRAALQKWLINRKSESKLSDEIKKLCNGGATVGFYPCSFYSNQLVSNLLKSNPDLKFHFSGFYDKSTSARTNTGLPVKKTEELATDTDGPSVLVIAGSNFLKPLLNDVENIFTKKILAASYFDSSLSGDPSEIKNHLDRLDQFDRVYNLLNDKKSKSTYLAQWQSRIFNDASYTDEFKTVPSLKIELKDGFIYYKNFKISDMDPTCTMEFQANLYSMSRVHVESDDTVLDLGAYKGDTAIYFADRAGHRGKVYAFEPTSQNFRVLEKNIAENFLTNQVQAINAGCSDKDDTAWAVTSKQGSPWSQLSTLAGNERVETITMDTFCDREQIEKIDFIKMDIEGYELKALKGAEKTLRKHKPKLAIALYHKSDDFFDIPLWIDSLNIYDVYLRAKMEGPFALTLFAASK